MIKFEWWDSANTSIDVSYAPDKGETPFPTTIKHEHTNSYRRIY